MFRKHIFLLIVCLMLVGCIRSQTTLLPQSIPVVAKIYLDKLGLTNAKIEAEVVDQVRNDNLNQWVEKIVDHTVGLDLDENGDPVTYRFSDLQEATKRQDAIADFKQHQLIEVGDHVIHMKWNIPGITAFETYGLEKPDGRIGMEPVLHFAISEVESVPIPITPGTWSASGLELSVNNVLGIKVAQGLWDVFAYCNPDCTISGPPQPVINTRCSEAWLWDAICNDGSKTYFVDEKTCPTGQEECLQWIIALSYTRFDNIAIQAGAQGIYSGVTLRLKVIADSIGWGDTIRDWGIVCCKSGVLIGHGGFDGPV